MTLADNASYFAKLSKSMPTLFGHGSFYNNLATEAAPPRDQSHSDDEIDESKSDLDLFSTAEENSASLIKAEELPTQHSTSVFPSFQDAARARGAYCVMP